MQLYSQVTNLQAALQKEKKSGHKIAFIPTMGALHEGHLSLIALGKEHAHLSVCSIFVNPTQFNNAMDLQKYPRTMEQDTRLLEASGCDFLFAPSNDVIYPAGLDTEVHLDLGNLDLVMEGHFRPGHFKGMLQVVKRLLDIVHPDYLIMGQKDFQQFTLVAFMIRQLQLRVKLIVGPTLRERDGLAMSSRNQRLNAEERRKAVAIYQCLLKLKNKLSNTNSVVLEQNAMKYLEEAGLKPEYVEIVDGNSLQKVINPEKHDYIVACIAAWSGEVRLIDNLILKGGLN